LISHGEAEGVSEILVENFVPEGMHNQSACPRAVVPGRSLPLIAVHVLQEDRHGTQRALIMVMGKIAQKPQQYRVVRAK
jgi:hypothetical protein